MKLQTAEPPFLEQGSLLCTIFLRRTHRNKESRQQIGISSLTVDGLRGVLLWFREAIIISGAYAVSARDGDLQLLGDDD